MKPLLFFMLAACLSLTWSLSSMASEEGRKRAVPYIAQNKKAADKNKASKTSGKHRVAKNSPHKKIKSTKVAQHTVKKNKKSHNTRVAGKNSEEH